MSIKIIVDSTVDLKDELKERVYSSVPLSIRFGDEEYLDGVTIDHKQFYDKLVNSNVFPTTSQANPESFDRVFASLSKNDQAIVITLSAKLSGTYQSAMIASENYSNVIVIDSQAGRAGLIVEKRLLSCQSGKICSIRNGNCNTGLIEKWKCISAVIQNIFF